MEQVSGEADVGTRPECPNDADDEKEETFVDIVSDVRGEQGAVTEGINIADAMLWANPLSETILEAVVNTSELPSC